MKITLSLLLVWFLTVPANAQNIDQAIACDNPIINYTTQQFSRTMHFNIPPGQTGEKVFHWYANNRDIADYAEIYIDGVLVKTLWVGTTGCQTTGNGETVGACRRGPIKYTYSVNGTDSIENLNFANDNEFENYFDQGVNSAIRIHEDAWRIDHSLAQPYLRGGAYHLEIHVPATTCQVRIIVGDTVSGSKWSGDLQCPELECEDQFIEVQGCGLEESLGQVQCSDLHQLSQTWTNSSEEPIENGMQGITSAGIYFLDTEFDGGNCKHRSQHTVSFLEAIVQSSNASCEGGNDGGATILASNGIGQYSYIWDHEVSGAILEGLVGGNSYQAVVSDELGCLAEVSTQIPFLPEPSVEANIFNPQCYGDETGAIDLLVSGQHDHYEVSWSNAAEGFVNENLGAGNYTATISYGQGCQIQSQYSVTSPPLLSVVVGETTDAACSEGAGTMELNITGGTPSYSVDIPGVETFQIEPFLYEVPIGQHEVVVTDSYGCQAVDEAIIDQGNISAQIVYEVQGCKEVFRAQIYNGMGEVIDEDYPIGSLGLTYHNIGQQVSLDYRGCPLVAPIKRKDDSQFHPRSYRINTRKGADTNPQTVDIYVPNVIQKSDPDVRNRFFGFFLADGQPEIRVPVMRVFDRWGGMVFENLDFKMKRPYINQSEAWDGMWRGREVETGVYTYYIDFGCNVMAKGNVTYLP